MDKRQEGLIHAIPGKRYKHCISTIADYEEVWLIRKKNGYAILESDNLSGIIVFAEKEFADLNKGEGIPEMMEVYDFLSFCKTKMAGMQQFCVFPTEKNCYFVSAKTFYQDLIEELERIE